MVVRVEVEGLDIAAKAMGQISDKAKDGIAKAVTATALLIRADVQKRIQRGPKTGAVYDQIFRTINGRVVPVGPRTGNNMSATHQASAPGEAPATDTGTLVGSIVFAQEGPLTATIGSRLAYAYYLEFGTRNMAPRPAWKPSVEMHKAELVKRVNKALAEATK
jgi:HK97 gp10 family phage protein